jgi:hypothetical protein
LGVGGGPLVVRRWREVVERKEVVGVRIVCRSTLLFLARISNIGRWFRKKPPKDI